LKLTTLREATRVYYEECADLYAEPDCSSAWRAAAQVEPDQQIAQVVTACRGAYCPRLTMFGFEACSAGFEATPDAIVANWPRLHQAILARDLGPHAGEVTGAMLAFYGHSKRLAASEPSREASPASPTAPPPAP
jgi:hypothetical protein